MDGASNLLSFPQPAPPAPGTAEPVAPGVRWLRQALPFALDHINLWLIEDGPGWTAVDAGYATAEAKALWQRIFAEGLEGRPITRILVTHYHPDHIGLAAWLAERWQAPLWITEKEWLSARSTVSDDDAELGPLGRDFVRRAGGPETLADIYAERHRGYRRGVPAVPPAFHRLRDGLSLEIGGRAWHVHIGEGHSPELALLHCAESGVFIAGDQILPKISPNVSVAPQEPEGDPLARYLASLARLKSLLPDDALVLPSHNLPFYGLHARIDELAAHHRARCAILLDACASPKSATDILPLLFRRKLDGHQMAFALGEALAHLHYLFGIGALDRGAGTDGVVRFVRSRG